MLRDGEVGKADGNEVDRPNMVVFTSLYPRRNTPCRAFRAKQHRPVGQSFGFVVTMNRSSLLPPTSRSGRLPPVGLDLAIENTRIPT